MLIISVEEERIVRSTFVDAMICRHCGNLPHHCVVFVRKRILLYFIIPFFSYGSMWAIECPICMHREKISEEAAHSLAPLSVAAQGAA